MESCIDVVPYKFSESLTSTRNQPLTLKELHANLPEMANEKSPRLDNFPCELCKATWNFLTKTSSVL